MEKKSWAGSVYVLKAHTASSGPELWFVLPWSKTPDRAADKAGPGLGWQQRQEMPLAGFTWHSPLSRNLHVFIALTVNAVCSPCCYQQCQCWVSAPVLGSPAPPCRQPQVKLCLMKSCFIGLLIASLLQSSQINHTSCSSAPIYVWIFSFPSLNLLHPPLLNPHWWGVPKALWVPGWPHHSSLRAGEVCACHNDTCSGITTAPTAHTDTFQGKKESSSP